jgi:hypothetical protein
MAEAYRKRVASLQEVLAKPGADNDAAEAIRSLVDKVLLVPNNGKQVIDLYGEIGPILKLAMAKQGRYVPGPGTEQLVLVAGACNQLDLQLQELLRACCQNTGEADTFSTAGADRYCL